MTIRYCPRCKTDVEDTGGYCLLGHRLALEPPVASLDDLRAEIDQAFDEARVQVAAAAGGAGPGASIGPRDDVPTSPIAVVSRPPAPVEGQQPQARLADAPVETQPTRRLTPPPPPPPRRSVPAAPSVPATPPASPAQAAPAPAPVDGSGTATPSAADVATRGASVWKGLDREVDMVGDPIGAFAPPPHMDWGPDKRKALKRKPARRSRRGPEAAE